MSPKFKEGDIIHFSGSKCVRFYPYTLQGRTSAVAKIHKINGTKFTKFVDEPIIFPPIYIENEIVEVIKVYENKPPYEPMYEIKNKDNNTCIVRENELKDKYIIVGK